MIEFHKNRGETPLEALVRLRCERPELQNETLSYAGRLDPMAEGILPVLVGEEENRNRREYLGADKVYRAEFLIGCSTDTGDVLGVVDRHDFRIIDERLIEDAICSLVHLTRQTYPWYSSKTVNGTPLFQYAREKKFDIVRPTREISVYEVKAITIDNRDYSGLLDELIRDIGRVQGDFRQDEVIASWMRTTANMPPRAQVVSFDVHVSSGTYIRALGDEIFGALGIPVTLVRLVRTKVIY